MGFVHESTTWLLVITNPEATKNPVPDTVTSCCDGCLSWLGCSSTHFFTALIAAALSFILRRDGVNIRRFSLASASPSVATRSLTKSAERGSDIRTPSEITVNTPRQFLSPKRTRRCSFFAPTHCHLGLLRRMNHACRS